MRRHLLILNRCLFPVLAVFALAFLTWELASGGDIPDECRKLGLGYGLVYVIASAHVNLLGNRVDELADEGRLPDWVRAQSEKNRSKARVYPPWGILPYVLFFVLRRFVWIGEVWVTFFLAANLAFQVGAFVGEYVIMAAQDRLLRNVEGWASGNGSSENESATPAASIIVKSADR